MFVEVTGISCVLFYVLCSCASRRNIWANRTALQLFNKNIQQFIALDYTSPAAGSVSKDDFATYNALNSLVHEEVEVIIYIPTIR